MMGKILGWAIFIFFFWLIFLSLYAFYIYTHPPRYISSLTPKDLGFNFERVDFTTDDGLTLAGWFIPSPKENVPTIIFCHGYPFDKGNILGLSEFLYPDYNLFLFDFRAMGESEGKVSTVGYRETKDLKAAVEYLKGRGVSNIGAMGFSLGAAVIIMANNLKIKAIVSDSSFCDLNSVVNIVFKHLGPLKWPLVKLVKLWTRLFLKADLNKVSPLEAVKSLEAPVLFIHGELDTEIPAIHSKQLYERGISLNKNVELWIVPGVDHGQIYFVNQEEYSRKVKDFFNKFLA